MGSQAPRVIVNDHRGQARSHKVLLRGIDSIRTSDPCGSWLASEGVISRAD